MRNKKSRYDLQSVLSTAGKLSCRRTALKRCTNIEIFWYRKLVSLASPEFREILLTRSLRRWQNMNVVMRPKSLPQLLLLLLLFLLLLLLLLLTFSGWSELTHAHLHIHWILKSTVTLTSVAAGNVLTCSITTGAGNDPTLIHVCTCTSSSSSSSSSSHRIASHHIASYRRTIPYHIVSYHSP